MRPVTPLPFLFLFACFVFCVVSVIAVKAPRFFVSVCGAVVLLTLLYLSMSLHSVHVDVATPVPPVHDWMPLKLDAPDVTVGLSNPAPRTASQATSGAPSWEGAEVAGSTVAPDWLDAVESRDGDVVTRVVEGELYATPEAAHEDALAKAAEVARDFLAPVLGDKVRGWQVPMAYVNDTMIKDAYLQPVRRDYGTMYRAHLLMNLSPEHRRDLEQLWRHEVVRARIGSAVGALGLVVLLLTTVAGYLKLDEVTQGYYSGRLKLAALALLTGGTATLLAVVRSATW